MKTAVLAGALLASQLGGPPATAAPVGPALQRPALMVKQPARAVLISAAQADQRIVAVGERGIVVLSDDRGQTWRQAPCPVSVTLTAVRFVDGRNGVAVGHAGTVLTTADAGESWQVRLDGRQVAQLALDEARKSANAARMKDAERLVSDGPDKPFLDVAVFDAQRFLAVGAYGIAFSTEDGGRSWSSWMGRLDNAKGQHIYVARTHGANVLLAGEQGLVLRSGDRGATFTKLASPYKGSWFTGEVARGEILLAGLRGNVWRSQDAGSTWTQLANPVPASVTASLATADGGILLANQAGQLLRLKGEVLAPFGGAPLPPPNGIVMAGDKLLTVGIAGVVPAAGAPR